MPTLLTDALVRRLKPPAKGNRVTRDTKVTGFGVRITAAGARAYVLNYRVNGIERRLTIGDAAAWTVGAAREQARGLRREIDQGIDPMRRVEPGATFRARAETFLVIGRKKRGLPLRAKTVAEYRRALLVEAKPLHERPLAEIKRAEVAELIHAVAAGHGVTTGARCRGALSRLYSWAIANGYAEANPVAGTESYATTRRDRVLTDDELRQLWAETTVRADFNMIVRLCLWTGARRGEAGGMAWGELAGDVWTIPSERCKNGRSLSLPLPRQALTALAAWPRRPSHDRLFGLGARGFANWTDAKARLDARLGFERPFTLHDIRRTAETRLAGLGIRREVITRVLNDAVGPIEAAYDHFDYAEPKRHALQAWADVLDQITGAGPVNVVPLRGVS